jgi:MoaA/NifB/PqqE/SkfB family radical SAM enzyme
MRELSFKLRNAAQRVLGLRLAHRLREALMPHRSDETGAGGDGWISIYPTWRCNLTCTYCQNLNGTGVFNPAERPGPTPELWAESLNRIGRHISISGGDPFAYPHLTELVNGIDPKLAVVLCTNLSTPNVVAVVESFTRPVTFDVTYHPSSGRAERLIKTVVALRAMGKFDGSIHAIAYGKSLPFLRRTQEQFSKEGLQLKINVAFEDLAIEGSRKLKRETVICSKSSINIGPDGQRYHCVTKAIRMQDPKCSITDEQVTSEFRKYRCEDYGHCTACDLQEPGMTIERVH